MISELARGDYEDLKAQGLNPTLEDFDRLNQIALRLTEGAETTCANFPRIGWAGDVPFFEPTLAAFAWYHGYAVRTAANAETEDTLWAFALAHARELEDEFLRERILGYLEHRERTAVREVLH